MSARFLATVSADDLHSKEIPEVTEEEQAVPNPGIVVTSDPTHDWLYNGMMVLLVLSLVCFGVGKPGLPPENP